MRAAIDIIESPNGVRQIPKPLVAMQVPKKEIEVLIPEEISDDEDVVSIGRGICAVVGGGVAMALSAFLGSFLCGIYYNSFPAVIPIAIIGALGTIVLGALIGKKMVDFVGNTP